jgi:hypothetical protein
MWETQHSIETSARPEAIWRVWSDVERWPEWNADLERAELSGPFTAGQVVTMYPRAGEAIELTIAESKEPERFVDEADFGAVLVRTTHRVERGRGESSRIVYEMQITGPEADTLGTEIGPQISADFPDVLAALSEAAQTR